MEVAAPNIEAFQTALTQRFKLTVEDFMVMKSRPQFLLCCMNQLASENSEQYYSRNRNLSPALHGCDHDNDTLTPSEISLRSIAVANFVPGLRNDWPRSCTSLKWRFAPTADPPPHRETEGRKEKEQERKRKLAAEGTESDNAKTQKHGERDIKAAHPPPQKMTKSPSPSNADNSHAGTESPKSQRPSQGRIRRRNPLDPSNAVDESKP